MHPEAATEVFVKDCLIPTWDLRRSGGKGKPDTKVFEPIKLSGVAPSEGETALRRDPIHIPAPKGKTANWRRKPARGFDLGQGSGQTVAATVHGGVVGLVLDGRGRPLATANNKEDRRLQMIEWAKALNLYPEG